MRKFIIINRKIKILILIDKFSIEKVQIPFEGATRNKKKGSFGSQVAQGYYDIAVIDEAGFAEMSEALIMMKPFKRVLLAGDHLQLPPVIKSEKAQKLGLGKSIMEHLVERIPSRTFMLETQFRSNYHISEWSSNIFYNGRLRPSAANHTRYWEV